MRAVIQRVESAQVNIAEIVHGKINSGLLVLVGIENADSEEDVIWLAHKICNLRLFDDESGLMNRSLFDMNGDLLLVSQFTLFAQTKKGNRPSYIRAAKPEYALPLYERLIVVFGKLLNKEIQTGVFGANMKIELINDGPVSIIMDTKEKENH